MIGRERGVAKMETTSGFRLWGLVSDLKCKAQRLRVWDGFSV